MRAFIFGITGGIGGMVAGGLVAGGDRVEGLVRTEEQRSGLGERGIRARVGDLRTVPVAEIAELIAGSDVVVFAAGSNGGAQELTRDLDDRAVRRTLEAMPAAGVTRFALVSVMPEAWCERHLGDDDEFYFAVKKQVDVAVAASELDWLILRPSLLTDDDGTGRIAIGAAQRHRSIPRADAAATLVALLRTPSVTRRILEVDAGERPIGEAVAAIAER